MKFSEQWLREWVNPEVGRDELVHQLTMAGLEVDGVEPVAPAISGVVIAQVKTVEPHPNAERLTLCKVDVGEREPLSIVCGAPNVTVGMRAPCARIGAVLADGTEIKAAKLRGVDSQGMLCSALELGLGDDADGLLALPDDAAIGADINQWLQLDDVALDVDLTPNRGDCLGVAGIAREVGVLNRAAVTPPQIEPVVATVEDQLPVELVDEAGCPRYLGRIVKGLNPRTETPLWMCERLRRSGIRSLGPVVDVTNYVMLELGQPMHAFDLTQLAGGIRVRRAQAEEKLVLLDGSELTLDEEVLVIADHEKALALAGIMGGEHSGCSDDTHTVLLESAFFAPAAIAGRGRRFSLHTDASHRFERGVDPYLQREAMERATRLLMDIRGGEAGPIIEGVAEQHIPKRPQVTLRRERLTLVLGLNISDEEIEDILTRLGMAPETSAEGWQVTAPSYRFDIAIEEDLIEEIGRIHGYEEVPETAPRAQLTMRPIPEGRVTRADFKRVLVERGYQEAITYSFVDPAQQALLDPDHQPIPLANPISTDMAVMRTNLWPGLLRAAVRNQKRQQSRVRLFESGLRFWRKEGEIVQEQVLAGVVVGALHPEQWGEAAREADFFDLKGDVEALMQLTGPVEGLMLNNAVSHPALHPGRSARIEKEAQALGWMGAVNPTIESEVGLVDGGWVFELALALMQTGAVPRFSPISRYPAIRRDIALDVDQAVSAQALCDGVNRVAGEFLKNLQLFDVYSGKGVDSGRKSLALGLTFQAQSCTLTDSEVEVMVVEVVETLGRDFGARLRE